MPLSYSTSRYLLPDPWVNATERWVFLELLTCPSNVWVQHRHNWVQLLSIQSDHKHRSCHNQWQLLWPKLCWFDQMQLQRWRIRWSMDSKCISSHLSSSSSNASHSTWVQSWRKDQTDLQDPFSSNSSPPKCIQLVSPKLERIEARSKYHPVFPTFEKISFCKLEKISFSYVWKISFCKLEKFVHSGSQRTRILAMGEELISETGRVEKEKEKRNWDEKIRYMNSIRGFMRHSHRTRHLHSCKTLLPPHSSPFILSSLKMLVYQRNTEKWIK